MHIVRVVIINFLIIILQNKNYYRELLEKNIHSKWQYSVLEHGKKWLWREVPSVKTTPSAMGCTSARLEAQPKSAGASSTYKMMKMETNYLLKSTNIPKFCEFEHMQIPLSFSSWIMVSMEFYTSLKCEWSKLLWDLE